MKLKNPPFAALLLFGAFLVTNAYANPTFNEANSYLTLPNVVVGSTVFNNVVVRVDRFTVVSVGGSSSTPPAKENCAYSDFTTAKYNAIQPGMTTDQVNQIIGCKFDPTQTVRSQSFVGHYWVANSGGQIAVINVLFDATGSNALNSPAFKTSSGF
ncbi:MAG: hypothetical protein V4627_15765 [Pseudomonadota bacterium]